MNGGYFLVHRSIWGSDQFKDEQFSQREAFMWMISEAAWKDTSVRYGDHRYTVTRGQFVSSIRRMADIWRWDKNKVDRFLNNLASEGCLKIGTNGSGKPRHVTICNYDEYQETRGMDGTTSGTTTGQARDKNGTYKKEPNQSTIKPVNQEESIDHFFETEFWPTYPKRVGKGDALKALKAAVKRSSSGEIIVGLRRACDHWRDAGTEMQFIPNPGKWLRADRWKDEQPACGPPKRFEVVNGGGGTVFDRLRRKFEDEENDSRLF